MGFELAVRANHAYSISCASFGPARAYIRQGRYAEAIRLLEQGLEQVKLHNVEAAIDAVLSPLAYAYYRAGRAEEALKLAERYERMPQAFLSGLYFLGAALAMTAGRTDAAIAMVRDAHAKAIERNERETIAWLDHLLGDIALTSDPPNLVDAERHYGVAAKAANELGLRPLAMECQLSLGEAAQTCGREDDAKRSFESALELAIVMNVAPAIEKARRHLMAY
jgi:tetratricopeptide (TPR) repeat protein